MAGRFLTGVPGPQVEAAYREAPGNEIETGKFDHPRVVRAPGRQRLRVLSRSPRGPAPASGMRARRVAGDVRGSRTDRALPVEGRTPSGLGRSRNDAVGAHRTRVEEVRAVSAAPRLLQGVLAARVGRPDEGLRANQGQARPRGSQEQEPRRRAARQARAGPANAGKPCGQAPGTDADPLLRLRRAGSPARERQGGRRSSESRSSTADRGVRRKYRGGRGEVRSLRISQAAGWLERGRRARHSDARGSRAPVFRSRYHDTQVPPR